MCWKGLLGVPWTARRSYQSIQKEISPEYSLEGLIAKAEALIPWPPDVRNWLLRKDPDAGNDWRQEEKGTTEDEMVGWHHWLDRHEFEQTLELLMDRETWRAGSQRVRHNWATELNWFFHLRPTFYFLTFLCQVFRLQTWSSEQFLSFILVCLKNKYINKCNNNVIILFISNFLCAFVFKLL